ncbi:phosphotransferase family protein [Flindersiella endophytica]
MRRLAHGYTNDTQGDGSVVVKAYDGPGADQRLERESFILSSYAGRLPLPPLVEAGDGTLTLGFVEGVHGQELLDRDEATARTVLAACGALLGELQKLDASELGEGPVLVHGDFGPNNLLFDPESLQVTALLDWEFAHTGEPIEDLAWCEWIVRAHHADRVPLLGAFFDAYAGEVPDWPVRQAAMLAKCLSLREFCERWEPGGEAVRRWEERFATTAGWEDAPSEGG